MKPYYIYNKTFFHCASLNLDEMEENSDRVSMSAQFSTWTLSHFMHETDEMCWWGVSVPKERVYVCERESIFNAPCAKESFSKSFQKSHKNVKCSCFMYLSFALL